jgi:hypothetical protein
MTFFKKEGSKWTNLQNEDTSIKEFRLLIPDNFEQPKKKRKPKPFSSLNQNRS